VSGRVALAAAAALVGGFLGACRGSGATASTATVAAGTGAPTAVVPATTARAATTAGIGPPGSTGATLDCRDAIDTVAAPPASAGLTTVLGVVALPAAGPSRAALSTNRTGDREPARRLFAKTGLLVHAGASLTLRVADDAWAQIGWGSPGHPARSLEVPACPGDGWLAFPGGYYVGSPQCLPIVVSAGGHVRRVTVGVGAACPGQSPPVPPSDS
jgi:hypothetical protein